MGLAPGDKIDNVTAYGLGGQSTGAIPVPFVVDQAKSFSYVIGTPAAGQHMPDGYIEVSMNNFASSTLATLNQANNTWTASIAGAATAGTVCARQVLAKDLYTPVWDDVQAGPVSCASFSVPPPTGAVSRKTHGSAGTFDINLPLSGNVGIECRTGGTPTGNHTIVVTFPTAISAVASATCAGNAATTSISGNQVTVNCTGVPNAQTVAINLTGVSDGINVGNVSIPMGVLLGDVNASRRVDSTDVFQVRQQSLQNANSSNFRMDVDKSGRIDSTDVFITRQQSLTALP
jgi:hypothetical protein